MIRLSLYVFLWIGSMAIAILATQNTYPVNLRLFSLESIKFPLGLVLVFSAGLGATCINLWQTSISFKLPKSPVFPAQNNPLNTQSPTKTATTKKDISKTNKRTKDSFDDEWDEDWG